jgi:hypothetical protein
MRGKYYFENEYEKIYAMQIIEWEIERLFDENLDEVELCQYDISPFQLCEVLEGLGWGEDYSEYNKENLWCKYSKENKKMLVMANVDTFSLQLIQCEEEE